MIITPIMTLICSVYLYAPEMNRTGKIKVNNIETTVLFREGDAVLVSYSFKDNASLEYLVDGGLNQYRMEDARDLQDRCKVKKK